MLDIKWIRSNPDLFKAAMIKRGLAAFDHPANKAILERNGNPEEPDKKLAILLENAKEAVVEKILPLEDLDKKRREMIAEVEKLQAEKNAANKEIGRKKAAKEPCEDLFAGMKQMSNKIKELDKALEEQENQFTDLLMNIPNAPHESVPLGFDEKANVEVKRWGTPKDYNFEVKDGELQAKPIDDITEYNAEKDLTAPEGEELEDCNSEIKIYAKSESTGG